MSGIDANVYSYTYTLRCLIVNVTMFNVFNIKIVKKTRTFQT